jgi:hypothetical protein
MFILAAARTSNPASLRLILGREAVKVGGEWNWLRFVSSGGLWY